MAKAPTGAPKGTSIAPSKGNALAIATDTMNFLAQHSGAGTENVSMADVIMPRISILQALSPQVSRRNPAYIEGAEAGQIINVATLTISDLLRVIPCHYIRHHIEWRPNRGGFVMDHGDDEAIMKRVVRRDDKNFDILDNGNIIIPTPTWYCLDVGNDLAQIVIPMPRTQSRASRSWMSQATNEKLNHPEHGKFPAPLFFRAWDLTTAIQTSDENEWFVWAVARGPSVVETVDGTPNSDLILPAEAMPSALRFRELLLSGAIKADASHFEDGSEGRGESSGGERTGNF